SGVDGRRRWALQMNRAPGRTIAFRVASTLLVLLAGLHLVADAQAPAKDPANTAIVLEISDAIGPATSDFFLRTLEDANESKAKLVVLQIDTPGGLDTSMRDMIRAILASNVPVATYVAPSGARAASAGTYLLYAS